jgi:Pvc16 N-terminal domain
MATYPAIAATSQAILGLLESAAPGTEFAGTRFEHYGAKELNNPMSEGVSLWLYGVTINTVRRSQPPRVAPDGTRYLPSLPLDLHYMLVAWGSPLMQQRLLGWCARVIQDTPIIPVGLLNHYGPEADVFGPEEAIDIVWESLSQQDIYDIWDVAKMQAQPAISYVARMLEIDSTVPLHEYALVQTRELDYTAEAAAT